MKTIAVTAYGGPEHMKLVEREIPEIRDTQVLIRVVKTSVNFADIMARYGKKGAGELPFIPGLDAAGVIERVGAAVTHLHPGQRVIAFPEGTIRTSDLHASCRSVLGFSFGTTRKLRPQLLAPTVA